MNPSLRMTTVFVALVTALTLNGCDKAPPGPTVLTPSAQTEVNVPDLDVTEHVKTALQQNDALKGFDIKVVTLKGDVRMTGVLDTQAHIDQAIQIARSAEGAHTIHDELTLKR